MPASAAFSRVLLRIIQLRGREAVEAIVTGEFDLITSQGGGKLVSTSVGGKAFSFQIPQAMNGDALMVAADEALLTWDGLDEEQRDLLFTQRPIRTARAVF